MAIIIDEISSIVPGFNVTISATWTQVSCSYELLFTDTSSPSVQTYDNVLIEYYQGTKLLGSTKKGQTFNYNFGETGVNVIRQVYSIYQEDVNHTNSREVLLYQADYEFNVLIQEWQPEFKFGKGSKFFTKAELDITPSIVELNNNVCGILPNANSGYKASLTPINGFYDGNFYANFDVSLQTLTYELFLYDVEVSDFLKVPAATQSLMVSTDNPINYTFNYETSTLGAYKLKGKLQNCCNISEDEIIFSTVDTLRIKRNCESVIECNDCTGYTIYNETLTDIEVIIYDQIKNKEIHRLLVPSLSNVPYSFTDDGVYRLSWDDLFGVNINTIIVNQCDIDSCYINLLKLLLCRTQAKPCCNDAYLESRLANVQPMYQTFISLIEPYVNIERRYSSTDITKQLQDFLDIGEIINQLLDFCDVCERGCSSCFDWNKGSCI